MVFHSPLSMSLAEGGDNLDLVLGLSPKASLSPFSSSRDPLLCPEASTAFPEVLPLSLHVLNSFHTCYYKGYIS
jgi:hypothetical protein